MMNLPGPLEHSGCKFGSDNVAERAQLIDQYVSVPKNSTRQKKRGAKTKWGDHGNFHTFIAVEYAWAEARKRYPKISKSETLRQLFKKLKGKPWCILHNVSDSTKNLLMLKNARQAANRHALGTHIGEVESHQEQRIRNLFPPFSICTKIAAQIGLVHANFLMRRIAVDRPLSNGRRSNANITQKLIAF